MAQINQSQKIILFICFLFFIATSYLFSIDSRYNDLRYGKNWFSIAFSDPKSDKLDFVIENFSSASDFDWEILKGEEKVSDGSAQIEPRGKKEIHIDTAGMGGGKMTVRVSSHDDVLEIYKNN